MASLEFEDKKTEFRDFYRVEGDVLRAGLNSFEALVKTLLSSDPEFPPPVVTSRIKDCDESISKFGRKYRNSLEEIETDYKIADHITDLLALRVICYYESDLPKVQKILESNFEVISVTDKNQELALEPNSFGYKGIHLDLRFSAARREMPEYALFKDYQFELQLRTAVQHSWSEIEHKISYKKSVPDSLRHRIVRLAGLFELADQEFDTIRQQTAELIAESENLPSEKSSSNESDEPLNSIFCNALMEKEFKDYKPKPEYADIFVAEIKALNPDITKSEFVKIFDENESTVIEYSKVSKKKINPFARIRHILYASDPVMYESIVYPKPRKLFDEWLEAA